ncbi:hypothetical protein, partial [Nitrosomonas sp.]
VRMASAFFLVKDDHARLILQVHAFFNAADRLRENIRSDFLRLRRVKESGLRAVSSDMPFKISFQSCRIEKSWFETLPDFSILQTPNSSRLGVFHYTFGRFYSFCDS